jgi:hypothetical protein
MYNDMYNDGGVHIETVGETRMRMFGSDGNHDETNAKWDLKYNNDAYGRGGLEGDINATENGETTKYRVQMDNRDLAQIFSAPHRQGMLGTRLANDFQMPRRRRQPIFNDMVIVEQEPEQEPEQAQVMDDSLMQLVRAMQQGTSRQGTSRQGTSRQGTSRQGTSRQIDPNRSRRMQINYSSGPRRRHKSHRLKRMLPIRGPIRGTISSPISRPVSGRRRTRRRRLRRKTPSFRSNVPLTEINA